MDIISKTEREYLKNIGYEFSDRERATVIYQLYAPQPAKRLEKLGQLMGTTSDASLKEQIKGRIDFEKEKWKLLTSNPNGEYAYIIKYNYSDDYYDEIVGVFRQFEQAEGYGIKRFGDAKFDIYKYQIVDGELPVSKHRSVFNKELFGDDNIQDVTSEYDGSDIGLASYHKKECCYYYTEEICTEKERKVDATDPKRFEHAFIPIPHPFERGDLVSMRCDDTIRYGVVELSREDWEKFLERVKSGLFVDFSDASLIVDFIDEDGDFIHDHISPLRLEKVDWKSLSPSDNKTLLRYATDLAKGEGAIDFFLLAYDERHGRQARNILDWHEKNDA